MLHSVIEVRVGVQDISQAINFYQNVFGFEVLESHLDHALVGVAHSPLGRIRLLQRPGLERKQPKLWTVGPRLLGMYSRDLAATLQRFEAAGGDVRPKVSYPYGPGLMTEAVASDINGVWWTMPQIGADGVRQPSPALEIDSVRENGELHTVVTVVNNVDEGIRFYRDAGGMTLLFDGEMSGEVFEEMTGMPKGASLRLAFLVGPDKAPARIELMSFSGIGEVDEPTTPPGGIESIQMRVDNVDKSAKSFVEHGFTVGREGPGAFVIGPAGLLIELIA